MEKKVVARVVRFFIITTCSVSVSGEEMRGLEEHGALDSWCNQII